MDQTSLQIYEGSPHQSPRLVPTESKPVGKVFWMPLPPVVSSSPAPLGMGGGGGGIWIYHVLLDEAIG